MSAAALFGAVHADGIVSSDVVGYNQSGLTTGKNKLTMVGGSFVGIGTDGFQMNGNITVTNIKGGTGAIDSDTLL